MMLKVSRIGLIAVIMAALMALGACSTKKNTAASRNYQAFITRYNVYFNGDQHFKETLKEMERAYEDDFTAPVIFMHPAEAYEVKSAPQPSGSFTRSIEKAQKAIQLHSIKKRPKRKSGKGNDPEYKAWMKREEYNPFLHNAWMMMGRSQYFGGDFLGAASTFYYVSRHFSWLPSTVMEAKLWEARSYCAMGWLFEAETILSRVKSDELTSSTLKELYNFAYADLYIRSHNYAEAIPKLREALRYASGSQKSRLNFLLGQLLSAEGKNKEAYEAYSKAEGAAASYRAKFNARIKQSEVFEGADISSEVKALKRMLRYGVNRDYQDQIYYAIGNLYLSRKDTANAIANYTLAAEKSTRNGLDKAIAQVKLGGLYYDRQRYDLAQPNYSEGVPQLPETWPGLKELRHRSDVLDELAVFAQNVVLNDSLLRLADMSEEDRLAVIERIIADLKKKEKEEADAAAREEYLAAHEGESNLNASNAPTTFQMNTDRSWYFYNQSARNAGRTEFQKKWGSRKLEENWRRRNKASFSMSDFETQEETDEEDNATDNEKEAEDPENEEKREAEERANDPHYPEYYLKQIPSTPEERLTANEVIQEGLYNSGLILKDKLEDYPAAGMEWDKLNARYPDNVYRLDVLYNRYLMAMRSGREDEGERWRLAIISEFPESSYAQAMSDPGYLDRLRRMNDEQESLYAKAYDAYLDNRNRQVHEAYAWMEANYPLSPLMPKFMFIDALAYVTDGNSAKFTETIREMLQRYPDTEMTPMASAWLKGMTQGRNLQSGGSNARGLLWDIRLTNDSTSTGAPGEIQFELAPDDPHYLVLLFSTDEIVPAQLLYEVARHNFSTYVVRDFDLELMNFGPLGMLIIKGFANDRELRHYRNLLTTDPTFALPLAVRPVEISRDNFEKLITGGGSFDDYFRFIGEETSRDVHEATLPPDEYPSAEEM
ncbi:MAG: tetratricopeptide repeat protein [Duncaniella sp.]|nr:tetratricopeptide repeat protein [Duncaniella sp.]